MKGCTFLPAAFIRSILQLGKQPLHAIAHVFVDIFFVQLSAARIFVFE